MSPNPDEKPDRTARKPRRRRRVLVTSLAVIAALVAVPVVVNEITPRPAAALLRFLIGQIDNSVQLGPFADAVADVTESEPVAVEVDGAPDAALTMYASGDATGAGKPVILLIHGGGWAVGVAAQIADYARLLASEGFVVANLDYSLAPEYEYPTPVLQSVAALDYLTEHAAEYGGDPASMFVGGNSAGAQLASQIAAIATNPGLASDLGVDITTPAEAVRGVILYSGPYDLDTVERDNFPGFRTYAWSYLGQKNWQDDVRLDELSTVKTATAQYPPTYMTSGDADPLEPQTYELDAVLRAKGVEVTSRYWTGSGLDLPHDYIFDLRTKAAQTAFDDTVSFVRENAG
jgi:acetyl esterase